MTPYKYYLLALDFSVSSSREKIYPTISPILPTPEMSGKLRYESQNNLPTSLFYSRSREKNIHFHLGFGAPCTFPAFAPFGRRCRLSSILVQERKTPFLGTPEMSGKLRYECRLYLHTFTAPIALCSPIFSLLSCRSREKTIYTPLYPLPGNSRNEWQIEI